MAAEKRVYPQMSPKAWATIRKRFKLSIPPTVTPSYLESIGISKSSIGSSVIPTLRRAGLIDNEGKPIDLVTRWRDDSQYPEVCEQILHQLYPAELLAIAPNKDADRSEIESWFGRETKAGERSSEAMASFYLMLLKADPSDSKDTTPTAAKPAQRPAKGKPRNNGKLADKPDGSSAPAEEPSKAAQKQDGAKRIELHFDIQIHISPEADPKQIEQIFQSMEDHLKAFIA